MVWLGPSAVRIILSSLLFRLRNRVIVRVRCAWPSIDMVRIQDAWPSTSTLSMVAVGKYGSTTVRLRTVYRANT